MGITKSSRLLKRKEYLFEEQSGLCFYCVNLMLPPAKGNGVRGRRSTPLKASTLEHLTRVVDHGTRERANTVLAMNVIVIEAINTGQNGNATEKSSMG
jgi:hypothetical protein